MHPLLAIFVIDDLIYIAVFAIAAAGIALLLAPKPPSIDQPQGSKDRTMVVERGTFTPYLRGRRRIGSQILWLSNLETGKNGSGPTGQWVYSQEAWVALCVGPAWKLTNIREDGHSIWNGSITRATHPSGTRVATFGRLTPSHVNKSKFVGEAFRIYWGEDLQPVNTWLGAATRVGVSSRWPSLCYIQWEPKDLFTQTTWKQIDYEIECLPESSTLTAEDPLILGNEHAASGSAPIIGHQNGSTPSGYFKVVTNKNFPQGTRIRVSGNSANGDYTVRKDERTFSGGTSTTWARLLWVYETVSGANSSGTVKKLIPSTNDGPNPAYVLDEMLFAQWPQGIGLDRDEWDTDTLEDLATLAALEEIPASIIANGGAFASESVEALMSDTGFVISFNVKEGLHRVIPIREPSVIPAVPEEAICDPLPQITTVHQEKPATFVTFDYEDRNHNFRTGTLSAGDDGEASGGERQKAAKETLKTVTDFLTAAIVVDRRGLERQSEAATYKLFVNHEGRYLYPGEAITAENIPERLRVVDVTIEPLTAVVEVNAVTDFMANVVSDHTEEDSPPEETEEEATEEKSSHHTDPVPPPAAWNGADPQNAGGQTNGPGGASLWTPRIRNHAAVTGATIYISKDDTDFEPMGQSSVHAAGGVLLDTMPNNATEIDTGPDVTLIGPDLGLIRDLTADTDAWDAGEQLLIVGTEIMFLKSYDVVDDTTITLRGIKRGQLGSSYAAHAVDDLAFVLPVHYVETFKHRWLVPGATVYIRICTSSPNGTEALDDVPSYTYTVPAAAYLGWSVTNPTELRDLDVANGTPNDLAKVLGTTISEDLLKGERNA